MNENVTELETVPLLLTALVSPPPRLEALTQDLRQEPQAGAYLCWAAAAVAVAHHYNDDLKQCRIATQMRVKRGGSGECCPFTNPISSLCDRPEIAADVLKEIGHFANELPGQPAAGLPTLDQVFLEQLALNRPVVIVKGNHVIVVYEAGKDGPDVTLEAFDPGKDSLNRTLVLTGNEKEVETLCLTNP